MLAVEIRPYREGDLERLLPRMRPVMVRELADMCPQQTPYEALQASIDRAHHVWSADKDGRTVAIFGLTPSNVLAGEWYGWLVSASEWEVDPLRAFVLCRKVFRAWFQHPNIERIWSYIPCWFDQSWRFFQLLGAKVSQPFVWRGQEYVAIYLGREDVNDAVDQH